MTIAIVRQSGEQEYTIGRVSEVRGGRHGVL